MWMIGEGCVPSWTSAGKAAASSDAFAAIPRSTSASLRNAYFRQVCQRSFFSEALVPAWSRPANGNRRAAALWATSAHLRRRQCTAGLVGVALVAPGADWLAVEQVEDVPGQLVVLDEGHQCHALAGVEREYVQVAQLFQGV